MTYNSQITGGATVKKPYIGEENTKAPLKGTNGRLQGVTVSKQPLKKVPQKQPETLTVEVMTPKQEKKLQAKLLNQVDKVQQLQNKAKELRRESAEAGKAEIKARTLAKAAEHKKNKELRMAHTTKLKALDENKKGLLLKEQADKEHQKANQKRTEGAQHKQKKEAALEDVQQQLLADCQKTQKKLNQRENLLSSVNDMLAAMKKQADEAGKEEAPKGSAPKHVSPTK